MRNFTDQRTSATSDEVWLLEHPAVFTQGQAGRPEHILEHTTIPIIQSDRGGQVTYHGPGQLIGYVLIDLRRKGLGVRELVTKLEQSIVNVLSEFDIAAAARRDAPGVYVDGQKIAALGLRVRKGCSYHGVSLNVSPDLTPLSYINPCGWAGQPVTSLADLGIDTSLEEVGHRLYKHLNVMFG